MLAFSVAASAKWHEKVLYSFQGGTDGYYPAGGVVFDNAGTFYGATNWGGDLNCSSDGCGTVFAVSRQTDGPWGEAIIYAFRGVANGATDGFTPAGGLIVDGEGNLYGRQPTAATGLASCWVPKLGAGSSTSCLLRRKKVGSGLTRFSTTFKAEMTGTSLGRVWSSTAKETFTEPPSLVAAKARPATTFTAANAERSSS